MIVETKATTAVLPREWVLDLDFDLRVAHVRGLDGASETTITFRLETPGEAGSLIEVLRQAERHMNHMAQQAGGPAVEMACVGGDDD